MSIERIGKAGASFRSLGDPLWDTSSSQGRLLSTLLAAIAEFERELIRERTGAGRKRAMANDVKFGRKPKLSVYQRQEAIKRRGHQTARGGRDAGVNCEILCRRYQHDLALELIRSRARTHKSGLLSDARSMSAFTPVATG